jgi:hypothetical protein
MRRRGSWALLFLSCTACGAIAGTSDAPRDAGASPVVDGAGPVAADAGDASVADASDASHAGDAADAADAEPEAAPQCVFDAGANDPVRTLTLVVTNEAGGDRYLITDGTFCDPYGISALGVEVPLRLGFQCICECPNPGPARPHTLRKLAVGESYRFTWDARELVTCSESVDCASRGWPSSGTATQIVAGTAAVGAGTFDATVGAVSAVPSGCSSGDGTTFTCPMGSGGPFPGETPPVIQAMCTADSTASAPFALPASGDVVVAISLTK